VFVKALICAEFNSEFWYTLNLSLYCLYFKINCQECKNCINIRYSCSTVGCVGWLVEQEALSEGVGYAWAYIRSLAMPGTSASYR
jgi:hypothetical protein